MKSFECCRYCDDRVVGCHSTCEKYIEAKAKHDEINNRKREDIMITGTLNVLTAKKFGAMHNGKKEV